MKTIGLIGGMSWESSGHYYRLINQKVRERVGGLHSAKCLMYSLDFGEIEPLMRQGYWRLIKERLLEAARILENGGAEVVLICTNTMHKVADELESRVDIPLIHIADAAAESVRSFGISRVGLIGTRFTMEEDFYRKRLLDRFGLDVLIPGREERILVDRIIFEQLCVGKIEDESRAAYVKIMKDLIRGGAGGILLGCTEIGLLVSQSDFESPLFDTTELHASSAVEFALSN